MKEEKRRQAPAPPGSGPSGTSRRRRGLQRRKRPGRPDTGQRQRGKAGEAKTAEPRPAPSRVSRGKGKTFLPGKKIFTALDALSPLRLDAGRVWRFSSNPA